MAMRFELGFGNLCPPKCVREVFRPPRQSNACTDGLRVAAMVRKAVVASCCLVVFLAGFSISAEDRFNSAKLNAMDAAIQTSIAEHNLPGGVLWLDCQGSNYHKAYGSRAVFPTSEPMTEDTIFDIASLTKVVATAPGLMLLVERSKLSLDDPVSRYLPEFKGGGKETITLRHLLTHTSGFGRSLNQEPDWANRESALRAICDESISGQPGSAFLYSDLNFILLGEIIGRVAGMKLEAFVERDIFKPLRMVDTCFHPPSSLRSRIAPTEKIGGDVLRGTVHDFKAQAMGGAAGHAGVFSTAADLARFARMMIRGGELDGVRILKPETVQLMTTAQSSPIVQAKRGLGWDIDSDFSRPRGDLFPIGSYGHTGFTGVCLWLDPSSQTFWIFLSNRIHPNPSGNIHPLQRTLGTLAAEAINGFDFRRAKNPVQRASPSNARKF
jgi:CubicO group peptidase (beta-lactamase class C family)